MAEFSLKSILKQTKSEYAVLASEDDSGKNLYHIDTGSYIFNAVVSGSIYKGFPSNRITALAGEQATGKTFYVLSAVDAFLKKYPLGMVNYFETEGSVDGEFIKKRGLDAERISIDKVGTVQDFRTAAIEKADLYLSWPEKERVKRPFLFVLDSLGNLSTSKEVTDTAAGSETKDMTRAQLIKGVFRVLTLKLNRANIPLLVTNHTYEEQGSMYPQKIMSGGSGLKYSASSIFFLSKSKNKDTTTNEVIGAKISIVANKSRLTVENSRVTTLLDFGKGLNRYYGLLDLAEKHGIIKKEDKRYVFPNKKSAFESVIYKNPEEWFTKDILDQLDVAAGKEYLYGEETSPPLEVEEDDK